ncbi:hypothetical protein I8752_36005 [Nostocaceae cyanobacterium CENA369]|uniref:Uncharacterized protein n=1 Tax=Dendronalium phyllosphericum CENA369 TaxID=1725256 RepID=A0A8J7IMD0_9NOST|nr:hypothetical protein [Dendronalium phyllosphericum]MBH8578256.1 hypothetical protein [Dendronalium phyllosphericum CENA369]
MNNEAVMNLKIFQFEQAAVVAFAPQIAHYPQPKSVSQTHQNINSFAGIFVIFMIIGFILGCLIGYRKNKKQRYNRKIEIIREVTNLDRFQKISDKESNMNPQITKQIEILEKIWNKSP